MERTKGVVDETLPFFLLSNRYINCILIFGCLDTKFYLYILEQDMRTPERIQKGQTHGKTMMPAFYILFHGIQRIHHGHKRFHLF